MPNDQTSHFYRRQERRNDLPHLPERKMPGAHGSLALSANAERAGAESQGTLVGARGKTNAVPYPRRHPQETSRESLSARLGDGGPRLFPAFGPRQPPSCLQALRLGREEKQDLMGR